MTGKFFTYIARCRDGMLYTGYTKDLEQRVKNHNLGKGAKFTRGRGPVEVIYSEEFSTKGEAMSREVQIKKMTKEEKLKMITVMNND